MQDRDAKTALDQALELHRQGRLPEALAYLDRAIALDSTVADAHYMRGIVLGTLNRPSEAAVSFQRAVALNPNHAEAYNNLGTALGSADRPEEAVAAYDRALALNPGYLRARENRAILLYRLNRHEAALADFDAVLAAKPADVESLNTRGQILSELRRFDAARESFRRAIAIKPDLADAHWNLALADLITGNFAEGWRGYEWRWKKTGHRPAARNFREPLWTGSEPLDGRTILLHAEQGYGDTIQFCRFAKFVAARGGRVILEVPAALAALTHTVPGVAEVVVNGAPLPAFDVQCPLMSLPLALGTRLETIPSEIPYLTPDPAKLAAWRARVGSGFKVGLVWQGSAAHRNDRTRSLPLARLLAAMPSRTVLYSLQKEISREDRAIMASAGAFDVSSQLADFSDTAALATLMDLVITVDTSVAHLAGALGVKTWLLLAYANDWRWLTERDDTPWYPTMRLFRQPTFNAWDTVIATVKAALAKEGP